MMSDDACTCRPALLHVHEWVVWGGKQDYFCGSVRRCARTKWGDVREHMKERTRETVDGEAKKALDSEDSLFVILSAAALLSPRSTQVRSYCPYAQESGCLFTIW